MTTTLAIETYEDALRALWNRSAYDRGYISNPFAGDAAADLGLRRTAALVERCGRPLDRYGVVHIAGSKGKGSTCVFIDAILQAAGFRTGRYTQPHLHSMRERIAVDGDSISEPAFTALTHQAVALAGQIERERPELGAITAFELSTAMAFAHFADAGCDLAVIEVGLGGALDATNIVWPLVSAITTLDLEHTAILGDTLSKIAAQKAGIIKPGRPVAVSPQPADALDVIEATARRRSAPIIIGGRDWEWTGDWRSFTAAGPWGTYRDLVSGLAGAHQVVNACTALAAVWLLREQGDTIDEGAVRAGLAAARWPGRFERLRRDGVEVVFDGAHTPASARALATALEETGLSPATIVLGLLGDKDIDAIGAALAPAAARFIVTAPDNPRAASIASVVATLSRLGIPIGVAPSTRAAISEAMPRGGSPTPIVVTGSLTTVAEGREALGLAVADPRATRNGSSGTEKRTEGTAARLPA